MTLNHVVNKFQTKDGSEFGDRAIECTHWRPAGWEEPFTTISRGLTACEHGPLKLQVSLKNDLAPCPLHRRPASKGWESSFSGFLMLCQEQSWELWGPFLSSQNFMIIRTKRCAEPLTLPSVLFKSIPLCCYLFVFWYLCNPEWEDWSQSWLQQPWNLRIFLRLNLLGQGCPVSQLQTCDWHRAPGSARNRPGGLGRASGMRGLARQ